MKFNPGDTVRMMPRDFIRCHGVPTGSEGIIKEIRKNAAIVQFPGRKPHPFRYADLEAV